VHEVLWLPADASGGAPFGRKDLLGTLIASRASAGGCKSLLPTDRSMRDRPLLAAAALALSMTRKAPASGVLCDLVFMLNCVGMCSEITCLVKLINNERCDEMQRFAGAAALLLAA
jgi:hypothetical protein